MKVLYFTFIDCSVSQNVFKLLSCFSQFLSKAVCGVLLWFKLKVLHWIVASEFSHWESPHKILAKYSFVIFLVFKYEGEFIGFFNFTQNAYARLCVCVEIYAKTFAFTQFVITLKFWNCSILKYFIINSCFFGEERNIFCYLILW